MYVCGDCGLLGEFDSIRPPDDDTESWSGSDREVKTVGFGFLARYFHSSLSLSVESWHSTISNICVPNQRTCNSFGNLRKRRAIKIDFERLLFTNPSLNFSGFRASSENPFRSEFENSVSLLFCSHDPLIEAVVISTLRINGMRFIALGENRRRENY